MITLVLGPCGPALLEQHARESGALWIARGVLSDEEVARLRCQTSITVLDHPIDPGDGAAIAEALDTIEEQRPGHPINVVGGGLGWLDEVRGSTLSSLEHDEETGEWVFGLGDDFSMRVSCAWRFCTNGRTRCGSGGCGQVEAGKPADLERLMLAALEDRLIVAVQLAIGRGDLALDFGSDARLELFNDSGGYEAWILDFPDGRWVVAQGGGQVSLGRRASAAPSEPDVR